MCGYLFLLLGVLSAASISEAITCYHCFDSYNKTVLLQSSESDDLGSTFVRCDKNKLKWNRWECPDKWPACIIMSAKVQDHYEVVRSCGERNFCAKYKPPLGVRVDKCRECYTDSCNDYQLEPDVVDDPLFTFNINVNLRVTKYRVQANKDSAESED